MIIILSLLYTCVIHIHVLKWTCALCKNHVHYKLTTEKLSWTELWMLGVGAPSVCRQMLPRHMLRLSIKSCSWKEFSWEIPAAQAIAANT